MKRISAGIILGILCLSALSAFTPNASAIPAAYLTNLVKLTSNPYRDMCPTWSPTYPTSRIAYFAYESDMWTRHIWSMNPDGSGKKQLSYGEVDQTCDYSPNGTKIAFRRWGIRGDYYDLMIMNADGTDVHQIASGAENMEYHEARWSPDGRKLACQYGSPWWATEPHSYEIHIMNIDGTNEVTVVTEQFYDLMPDWSPDGTKLVYGGNDGIWVVDTTPPYQKTRLLRTALPTHYPKFSPDGRYILYGYGTESRNLNLCLITSTGNFVAQLTSDNKSALGPDWSPDGQYIVFTSSKSGVLNIWRARIVLPPSSFSDGFESGSFSKWTGISVSSSGIGTNARIVSFRAFQGLYSARFNTTSTHYPAFSEWAYCYKITMAQSNLYAKGYFFVTQSGLSSEGSRLCLIEFKAGTSSASPEVARAGWRRIDGELKWFVSVRTGTGWSTAISAVSPLLNTWYSVQLHWYKSSANGKGELWINNVLVCSFYAGNTAYYGSAMRVEFGIANTMYSGANTVYLDSCTMSTQRT